MEHFTDFANGVPDSFLDDILGDIDAERDSKTNSNEQQTVKLKQSLEALLDNDFNWPSDIRMSLVSILNVFNSLHKIREPDFMEANGAIGFYIRGALRMFGDVLAPSLKPLNDKLENLLGQIFKLTPFTFIVLLDNMSAVYDSRVREVSNKSTWTKLAIFGSVQQHREVLLCANVIARLTTGQSDAARTVSYTHLTLPTIYSV